MKLGLFSFAKQHGLFKSRFGCSRLFRWSFRTPRPGSSQTHPSSSNSSTFSAYAQHVSTLPSLHASSISHIIPLGGRFRAASPVTGSRYQFSSGSSKHSPTVTILNPYSRALSIMNCVKPCTVRLCVSCARPSQARTPKLLAGFLILPTNCCSAKV